MSGTLTRILNNQISNAQSGNSQFGINGNLKLQEYSVAGSRLANNLNYGSNFTATGNVVGGNIYTAGEVSATGNLIGNYFLGNIACATGYNSNTIYNGTSNVLIGTANGNITMSVDGTPNVVVVTSTGIQTNTITATGTVTGGNLTTGGTISATSTITGGNVATGGTVSATGNVTGGNVITVGTVDAGSLITSGNAIIGGDLFVNGNTTYINITDLNVEDPIIGLGRGPNNTPLTANDGKDRGEQLWYFDGSEKSAFTGYDNNTGKIIVATDVTIANEIVTVNNFGTFQAGNIESASVSATGNITGGNIATSGALSASSLSASGNIDGGNLRTAGAVTASGTVTGGNLATGGTVSATGNVTGGNVLTGGQITSTGAGNTATNGGQIFLNGATLNRIDWNTNGTGAPEYTTRSAGAKVVLYPSIGGSATDYALGVEAGALWSGIPGNDGGQFFKWYGGNVPVASLSGTGVFSATGNVTGANLFTGGAVSATGNVTGNYIIGNGSQLTGVTAASMDANNLTGNTLSSNVVFSSLTSVGSLTTLSVVGTATTGNLATGGTVSATGNVTGGNVLTGGSISATGNATAGNITTGGIVSATGNILGGANISVVGNSFTLGTGVNTVSINNGTISTAGNVQAANFQGTGVSVSGTVTADGNLSAGNISTAGMVTGGNISTAGNVTGGNILFGSGVISGTGNIYAGEIFANITGNIDAAGSNTEVQFNLNGILGASAGFTFNPTGNVLDVTGDIEGGNLYTIGAVSATGNVTGNYFIGNGALLTGIDTTLISNGNTKVQTYFNSNVAVTVSGVSNTVVFTTTGVDVTGTVSATGNITGANVFTGGLVSATGNITGANVFTGGLVSATGNATVGNVLTGGLVSASGNVTGANLITTGNVDANNVNTDTVYSSGALSLSAASGNITLAPSGNIIMSGGKYINNVNDPVQAQDAATKQYVDNAVSTGITIHAPVYVESPTALNATYAQGGTTATVTDTVAGNTVVFSTAVNLQPNDQLWFSNSFQGITANTAYFVVSAPNTSAAVLSLSYSGAPVTTITSNTGLTQSVRINSGVGATLTNAGANATLQIDGVTLSNTQRVLIYQQANAVHNGVYVVSEAGNATTAWQLTRSSDMNFYAPDDIDGMDAGDYFFVQAGDTGAGESYVMTAPVGPFVIGYNNLTFTQFSSSQVYSANTNAGISLTGTVFSAKVDNNTTAFDLGGNITVKAGANLTTPNIGAATGTSLSLTGNITSSNMFSNGVVSATGNVIAGNVDTAGTVSATGNVTGANLLTGGNVNATGNIFGGNIQTAGVVSATGNILGGNISTTGRFSSTGNVTAGNINTSGAASVGGNITGGNIDTVGTISATGTGTFGNVNTAGTVSAIGNLISGNVLTGGFVSATGNVTGGNILYGSGIVSGTGNIYGANIIATDGFFGNINLTGDITVNSVKSNTYVSATGNVVGGNVLTGGFVSATGNVTGNYFIGNGSQLTGIDTNLIKNGTSNVRIDTPNGNVAANVGATNNVWILASTGQYITGESSATGNVTGGNILTGGLVSATGNATAGNVLTGGVVSATGNATAGNVLTGGVVSATGNITGGNISTAGELRSGNIVISGDDITDTNGRVNINTAGADVDFAVNGDTVANILYIDAGTGTASFGSSSQTVNAIVAFNATNSVLMPVGNTIERPATGVTGMMRFNTTLDKLEIYDSNSWEEVGAAQFTVIADEQFAGDGSTVTFVLSTAQTSASVIVSINGVVQIPGIAYNVTSGTNLTFTEAPQVNDVIDVREITTTTTVTSIMNTSGNAAVSVTDISNVVTITGQLSGVGNALTIQGDVTITGNATISGNISGSQISNGNSRVQIPTANGNVNIDVGVTNDMTVFAADGVYVTGNVSVTGDVTAQNVNSLSDATLKTNVEPITNAGVVVDALQGVGYDWTDGSGHAYGMLAQKVEEVLPEAVRTDANGIKSVNYQMVIPFLVETVKELRQDIAEIKSQLKK
jgi:filamentous hemagglutinin